LLSKYCIGKVGNRTGNDKEVDVELYERWANFQVSLKCSEDPCPSMVFLLECLAVRFRFEELLALHATFIGIEEV